MRENDHENDETCIQAEHHELLLLLTFSVSGVPACWNDG
jgi:hypothetical protein